MPSSQLRLPSNIVVRGGCSESLGEVTKSTGLTRVLLVTDPYMFEKGPVKRLVQRLEAAGIDTAVYSGV